MTTDGGGIRGISEAVILHEIMKRIQTELGLRDLPRPCDYFHLIGGTSTGGQVNIPVAVFLQEALVSANTP